MESPLPFLISIPHGGEHIPECIRDRVALTRADILEDGDAFTRQIYDLGEHVHTVIQSDTARAVVDLNRDVSQMPPDHPDGVLKTVTCYKKPVYREGRFPSPGLVDRLIAEHYRPYHDRIRGAMENLSLVLGLDCHSMAEQAPPIEAQPGCRRPLICLSNACGRSCEMRYAETLAACFCEVLALDEEQVTLNEPFSGGFITCTYGNNPIPWIQLEINRSLYLRPPWHDASKWTISKDRLAELSSLILRVLRRFHCEITR
jgi:N-formylglutamate deformylase